MAIYSVVFLGPRMALAMNHVSPGEEILEVVEIEIFAVEEKPLPRARHYVIRPGARCTCREPQHRPYTCECRQFSFPGPTS